jgi:putative transposase
MQNARNQLIEELAKECRTVEDIQEMLKNLFKDTIQQVFEGEIEDQIGYEKHNNVGDH